MNDPDDDYIWSGRLSDIEDSEPEVPSNSEGDPEEYMTFEVIPWAHPIPRVVLILPGVSVLNWYLYTGQGKIGFTYADDRTV